MGYYDWEKIFKKKSDKELYDIYSGKTHLDSDARSFAEAELKKRKVNLNKIDKHKKKWKIEQLIQEERQENTGFGFGLGFSDTIFYLIMGLFGIAFTIVHLLDFKFHFIESTEGNIQPYERFIFIAIGLLMIAVGFISYKMKKRRKKFRDKKTNELIDQI